MADFPAKDELGIEVAFFGGWGWVRTSGLDKADYGCWKADSAESGVGWEFAERFCRSIRPAANASREGTMVVMQDINQILGNCSNFYSQQAQRLLKIGIDVSDLAVSHLAFRTETLVEYLETRRQLEPLCSANVENIWGSRPISKLLLKQPLPLAPNIVTSLLELIPPVHPDMYQSVYKMGLEHVGVVIGEAFADFGKTYAPVLTGQQDQGPFCQPYFITFSDYTNVKFYRHSLQDVCILEGKRFDGFYHAIE